MGYIKKLQNRRNQETWPLLQKLRFSPRNLFQRSGSETDKEQRIQEIKGSEKERGVLWWGGGLNN